MTVKVEPVVGINLLEVAVKKVLVQLATLKEMKTAFTLKIIGTLNSVLNGDIIIKHFRVDDELGDNFILKEL